MINKYLLKFLSGACLVIGSTGMARAGCDCNHPPPAGFPGGGMSSVCGLQTANVQLMGSSTVCYSGTASCSTGPVSEYSISFSTPVRAFWIEFPGGFILSRTVNGVPSTYDPCTHPQFTDQVNLTANSNNITSVTLQIRWPTTGPNKIEVYGYVRTNNAESGLPDAIVSYGCNETTFTWLTAPAMPASIFLSSPKCYPRGWLLGNQASPGATSYTWSGAVSGTFYSVVGPFISDSYSPAYVCVFASNACGSSAPRCSTITIPRVSWCGGYRGVSDPGEEDAVDKNPLLTKDVNVFPNPATDQVTVYLKGEGTFTVDITNLTGRSERTVQVTGNQRHNIDVSRFAPGLYLFTIRKDGLVIDRRKITVL
ncbi:MAG: T9SS type A sorting domain-containing protein [Chitinophagaceae bacterium]|nr:T9SS type A sorting domain-containing protein [Chitinophagaceae bacterium]